MILKIWGLLFLLEKYYLINFWEINYKIVLSFKINEQICFNLEKNIKTEFEILLSKYCTWIELISKKSTFFSVQ